MKRRAIPYREASVAATFFEPAYQRLRLWHNGKSINLLCFVRDTGQPVRQLLDECGAIPSASFRARCFSEVWELPHDESLAARFDGEIWGLDKEISNAMGCLGGAHSAATGYLLWGDIKEGSNRRHFASKLLQESETKRGRGR